MSKGICRIVSIALIVLMLTTVGPLEGLAVTMQSKNIPAEMSNTAEPLRVDAADENGQDNVEDDVSSATDEEQVASSGERTFALQEKLQQSLDHMRDQYAAYLARKSQGTSAMPKKSIRKAGENDGITYRFDDATKTLTFTGAGAMDDYGNTEDYISSESSFDMSTLPPWYSYADKTQTVVIGEGITALGSCSFMLFSQLKTVQLPTTLTRIGDFSFAFTDALETITLPSGLTELGFGAFFASGLPAVDVPAGVAELNNTFGYCWNLNRVILHEGLQVLDGALQGVVLPELTIPSTVNNAAGNYLFGLHLLYNYSKNATFIQDTELFSSSPLKEDALRGYLKLMAQTNKPGFNWDEFDEYEAIRELMDRLNEKYGTTYAEDDLFIILEDTENAEIIVYCYDDSQEHDQVKNSGYKHYIIQEDGTLSDSLCPDYGTGTAGDNITWHMDFETHTLVFEGHGRMTIQPYRESDYPWSPLANEVEQVQFVCDDEGAIENLVSRAFYQFKNLQTVVLPDGMTAIDSYAFSGCSSLQRIEIGSALESLDYGVFYDCSSLTELILSEGNTLFYLQDGCLFKKGSDGDTLYFCMPNVTQLVLEDDVIGVESGAFSAANALEQLTANDTIELSELSDCRVLQTIVLNETNTRYCIVDGILYNKDMTTLIFCPRNKESIEIPNTVTTISGGAFSYCNEMKELVLPESVTSARYAFEDCTGLESITFLCTRCDLELLPRQIVIYGYAGSSIETFARDNGYQFVPIYTIVSAELKSAPTQTMYYTVENLHTSGLTITVTYENGTVADITNGFKVSGFVKGQVGTQTLTVEYQEYTFHFDVQVEEVPEIIAGTQETIDKSTAHFPMYWRFTPAFDGEFSLTANGSFSVYHQNLNYDSHIVFYGSDVRFTAEAGETYYIELTYLNSSSDDETVYLRHNHVFDANLSETCTICGGRIGAWMQGACGDQLNYTLYDEGTLVLTGSGQMTSAPWSSKRAYIKRVVLPDGLTTISESAFGNCRQLQSIVIPPSVEVISFFAFYSCYQLSSITIENPRCSIEYIDIPEQATIYGYLNSTAEAYANRYNRTFVSIDIDSVELKSPPTKTIYQRWEDLDTSGLTLAVNYKDGRTIEDTTGFTVTGFEKGAVGTQTLTVSYFGYTMTFDVTVEDYPVVAAGTRVKKTLKLNEIYCCRFTPAFAGTFVISASQAALSAYDESPLQDSIQPLKTGNSFDMQLESGHTYYFKLQNTYWNEQEASFLLKHQHVEALPFTGFCGLCGEPLETIAKGSFGEDVQYTLYQEGTMVISGSGEMTSSPGYTYRAKHVIVHDGVTSICDSAFSSCKELVSVDLPDTVTSIGRSAFSNCSKLESIKLSANLASVGAYAFRNCPSLSEIVLPANLSTIGYHAFENCTALTTITIPAGVEIIDYATFSGCTSLESVTLPETVTQINTSAFESCSALKAITIPAGMKRIGDLAFAGSGLESITFSGSTVLGGDRVFYQSALNEVVFLDEVKSFDASSWKTCNVLTAFTVSEGNQKFSSVDGVLYNKDQTKLIFCPKNRTTLVLPDTVAEIEDYALFSCNQLTDITMSPNVTKIGYYAFADCTSLQMITIPETVNDIDIGAFYGCESLESIAIPSGVTSISDHTFESCRSLKEVVIPDSVTSFGAYVFYRCSALETIDVPETVASIDMYAFAYCSSLESIVVPDGVTSISLHTFSDCSSLKEVVIPDSVTSIESYAFYNCSALEAITIPESVTIINQNAFYGCNALASVSVDTTETATLLGPKIEAEETHIVSGDPNWKKSADLASGGRCLDKGKDFDFMLFVHREGTYTLSERACYNNRSFNLYVDGEMLGTYYPDLITSGNNDRYYTDFEIAAIPLSAGFHTIRITASSNPPIFDYFTVTSEAEGETAFAKTAYAGLAQIDANAFASCGALSSVRFTGTISNWRNISIANGNDAFINAVQDHSHVFGDAVVDEAATCAKIGTSHYACDTCGFEVRFETEKLQHEYELTEHAATDGHEAYKEYVCKNCGDTYTELYPASAVEGFTGVADANKISLSWLKAVEASVSSYEIFRKSEAEDSFTLLKTISSRNTLAYTDGNLDDGIYRYKIRAMKGSIAGTFTDEIAVSTIPDTQAPRVLSAGPKAKTVQNGTITLTASAEDNVAVTKLVVSASSDKETWDLLYTSTSNKLQYRFDTSTYADGTVYLKYVAYDKAGNQSEDYLMEYTLDNTGPQKVMNIKLVQVFASSATLSWDADSEGETYSYTVERFDSAKETFVPYKKGVKTTGINLSGLLPETDYKFRVAGVDAYGNLGEWSEVFSFGTPADTTAPVITRQSPASCSVKDKVNYTVTATDDTALLSIAFRISQNHAEWITVAEKTASGTAASVSYTFDLSAYAEGIVEVSAVAKDSSGNTSSTTNAPYTEYRIDRTAPQMPAAPTAVGRDGYIDISWNAADDGDTSAFRLYRSTEKNGTYEIIKQGSLISFSDTAVQPGTMYWYKLRAVDAAGNVSGFSDAVSAAPTEDVTPPAIADLILSADKRVVTVKGTDNHFTDSISVEYSLNQKGFTPVSVTYNTRGATTLATAALPVFDNGKNVTVRAKAFDAAGNESDWTSVTFTADTAAPTLHDLQAALNDGAMTISWKDGAEEDLAGFEIYYSVNGGTYKLFISRAASASHEYTVTKSLKSFTNGSYRFRVDAIDTSQNRKSYETDTFEHTQGIDGITTGDGEEINKLNAVITVPAYLETEVGELFDASASTSASEIVSYAWTFGDGTTAKGKTVEKRYEQQGAYTVALTITDALGNTNTAETTVTVLPRAKYGFASIKVTDENGKALRGATVCMNFGEEDQFSQMTDANGKVTMRVVEGTHTIAASNGADYLPASGSVKIVAGETTNATLTLENGTIMTSDLTVKKMTLDEIIAAGISVSDPANNSYYSGNITIFYHGKWIHYTYVRTETKIESYHVDVPEVDQLRPVYIPNDAGIELIAFIHIPVKAGYLKDFYSVNFMVCNNASAEFAIDDLVATVAVPNGMTLMRGLNGFEETATVKLGTITGQSSKNVMWCLRADRAGSYDINVSADGTLRGFDTPLYTSQSSTVTVAKMSERMQVIAEFPEGIYVQMKKWRKRIYRMEDPSLYIAAEKFDATAYFNVGFENIGVDDLYCPTLDVDAVNLLFKTDNLKDNLDVEEVDTYVVSADGTRTKVSGSDVLYLHAGEKYLKYFKITFSEDASNDAFDVFMQKIENFRTYYHDMDSNIFLSRSSDPDMQLDVTLDSAFFDQLYYGREIPVYEPKFSQDPYLNISLEELTSHGDYHQFDIGETNQLTAELMPDNVMMTEGLTWKADGKTAFSVSSTGAVKAKAIGETYVSVSDEDYASKGEYCLWVEEEEEPIINEMLSDYIDFDLTSPYYYLKDGKIIDPHDPLEDSVTAIVFSVTVKNPIDKPNESIKTKPMVLSVDVNCSKLGYSKTLKNDAIECVDYGKTSEWTLFFDSKDLIDAINGSTKYVNKAQVMLNATISCDDGFSTKASRRIVIENYDKRNFRLGYNWNTDRWSFANFVRMPTEKQFENLFDPAKAHSLYLLEQNYGKGVCYGMALSTISLLENNPAPELFKSSNKTNRHIIDITKTENKQYFEDGYYPTYNDSVDDFLIVSDERYPANGEPILVKHSVSEFIHYSLLTWLAAETVERDAHDCISVYNAVKDYVYGEKAYPPIITLAIYDSEKAQKTPWDPYVSAHSVLAIGVEGNRIIVNNSNSPDEKEYIELEKEDGKFTGKWHYNSYRGDKTKESDLIEWCDGSTYKLAYQALKNDLLLSIKQDYLDEMERQGIHVEAPTKISVDKNLVVTNTQNLELKDVQFKLRLPQGDLQDANKLNNVAWVETKTLVLNQTKEPQTSISFSDNKTTFSIFVPQDTSAELFVSDAEQSHVSVSSKNDEEIKIDLWKSNGEDAICITVSGLTTDSTVSAVETDSGMIVSGLNEMTLTYSIDDEVIDTVSVPVTDGREVNITVDEATNEITTDFACEHDYVQTAAVPATCSEPGSITYTCSVCGESYVETLPIVDHKDDNQNGKCDYCNQKMTGKNRCKYCGKIHKGFGGFFTKIIHSILYFFAHLFRRM